MAILVYATPSDLLNGWLGEIPEDADALLRYASLLVDGACRLDNYDTDDQDRPTDLQVIEAFRDATCQQVASWKAAKIDPLAGVVGQAPRVASQSTEGDSVTYANLPTTEDIARATKELCHASVLILQLTAGLATRSPGML